MDKFKQGDIVIYQHIESPSFRWNGTIWRILNCKTYAATLVSTGSAGAIKIPGEYIKLGETINLRSSCFKKIKYMNEKLIEVLYG